MSGLKDGLARRGGTGPRAEAPATGEGGGAATFVVSGFRFAWRARRMCLPGSAASGVPALLRFTSLRGLWPTAVGREAENGVGFTEQTSRSSASASRGAGRVGLVPNCPAR